MMDKEVLSFAKKIVSNTQDVLDNMHKDNMTEEEAWHLLRELSEISDAVNEFLQEQTGGFIADFVNQVEMAEKGGNLEELDVFVVEENQ